MHHYSILNCWLLMHPSRGTVIVFSYASKGEPIRPNQQFQTQRYTEDSLKSVGYKIKEKFMNMGRVFVGKKGKMTQT